MQEHFKIILIKNKDKFMEKTLWKQWILDMFVKYLMRQKK